MKIKTKWWNKNNMVRNNNINNTRQDKASSSNNTHPPYMYIQTSNSGSDGEWDNCGDQLDS